MALILLSASQSDEHKYVSWRNGDELLTARSHMGGGSDWYLKASKKDEPSWWLPAPPPFAKIAREMWDEAVRLGRVSVAGKQSQ